MLGDGTSTDKNTPTQESTGATNWSVIAAGGARTVALKSDGTLWAWGSNWAGQFGDGTNTVETETFPRGRRTPGQTGSATWSAIAAGYNHTVALK